MTSLTLSSSCSQKRMRTRRLLSNSLGLGCPVARPVQRDRSGLLLVVGGGTGLSWSVRGEMPGGAVVVESEVDESFEVDDGCSDGEPDAVAGDAALAAASVAVGDEPCNGAFDHGPMLAVVVDEVGVGSPAGPVRGEVLIVLADEELLAGCC